MAAYSTGASWSFPEDLPGGWVDVKPEQDDIPARAKERGAAGDSIKQEATSNPTPTSTQQPNTTRPQRRRQHYPPRQCRICLETLLPTFQPPEPNLASSLPSSFQPQLRVTYASPPGDGGRLLRPCKCKGSQKYVHEECLSAWRLQDPLQKRNYWQCPTCRYKYHLHRLTWASWLSSTPAQVALTITIFVIAMFALGFIADPIINLYLDPVSTIADYGRGPTGSLIYEDAEAGWLEHFVKGLTSLGLLGFAKFLLTLSPWHWFNMRGTGVYIGNGGGGARGSAMGGTGRDRMSQVSWIAIVVGIATFLYAVWKGVRAWSRRTLEKAGERVMDVPVDVGGWEEKEDDEEVEQEDYEAMTSTGPEDTTTTTPAPDEPEPEPEPPSSDNIVGDT